MKSDSRRFAVGFAAIVGLAFAALPSFGFARTAEGVSSCIACHRNVTNVSYLEHNFSDWKKSVHAMAGVGCELCHGGDPSGKKKEAAHAGVISSTQPDSRLYFTQVPATCGECHDAEFESFKASAHHRELQRSGRGPNCVTCHGSMANHVMSPRELEKTCTLCHRRPTQAYATLLSLNNASSSLERLRKALDAAASRGGVSVKAQRAKYEKASEMHSQALVDWHTFKMKAVLGAAQKTTRIATGALNELRIKNMQRKIKRGKGG